MDVLDDVPERVHVFNTTDRCDQCGAQAYAGALVNGTELLWCAHHFTIHAEKILTLASVVIDGRHELHS